MNLLIEIKDLRFRYGREGAWVIDIPSFQLRAREKVFLLGPSGSGKSTLLELLSGVLQPTFGEVKINGSSFSALSARERDHFRGQHMGYIFQSLNLIPYLSIRENIALPARLNPDRARKLQGPWALEVDRLATKLGLAELLDRPVSALSVGQQQQVAAARALIAAPALILADEPTSALDFDHRDQFLKLLFEVAEGSGAGILFVSHDRSLQNHFDRVVSLPEINRAVRC